MNQWGMFLKTAVLDFLPQYMRQHFVSDSKITSGTGLLGSSLATTSVMAVITPLASSLASPVAKWNISLI